MKKYALISILTLAFFGLTATSHAQELKTITLKDGSVLKGKVVQLTDGIYTLETSNLGSVNIPESNILSIASPQAPGSQKQQSGTSNDLQKAQLKSQVQQVQGTIMSNPGLMMEIQNMVNDEEVKALLSDPKLLEDVMSFDPEKIQTNTGIQNLMQNPKMLDLMNKIQQNMSAQE